MVKPYLRTLKEISDNDHIDLSNKCKNTIDGLLNDDKRRKKAKELKLKDLPKDFKRKNSLSQDIGPSIDDLNKELAFKSISPSSILDSSLRREVEELNPNKFGDNINLNELTPSILLKLDKKGDISLSSDQVQLLEEAVKSKVALGRPKPKSLEEMIVYELPGWLYNCIPDVNPGQLNKQLNELNNLGDIPPKEILKREERGEIQIPHLVKKDLVKIEKVIDAAKDPNFNAKEFKLSDRALPKIGIYPY